jgi:hypothetical protein
MWGRALLHAHFSTPPPPPLPEQEIRRRCLGGWMGPGASADIFGTNINKLVTMAKSGCECRWNRSWKQFSWVWLDHGVYMDVGRRTEQEFSSPKYSGFPLNVFKLIGDVGRFPWFQASAAILMRSALFWDVTRRRVVIVYRRLGTTYRSHHHGSRVRVGKDSWPVNMEPIYCPETSVNNYHTTPHNIPEERRYHVGA